MTLSRRTLLRGAAAAARGHSQARIDKIPGRNLPRLYKDVWDA